MSKKVDLTGQQFADLFVIQESDPYWTQSHKKKTMWECLCKCGNKTIVESSNLKNGHTTSCGCNAGRINYIGKRFGRLVAKEHLNGGKYQCLCDCGNTVIVSTFNLTNGNTQSCGCYQRDRASESTIKDLTGQKYGMLTVLSMMTKRNRYGHCVYKCKCDCGSISFVDASNLRKGTTQSCGCIKSRGEAEINKWLQMHNINFQQQYSHDDIVYKSGRRPLFDFAIFDNDNNLLCFIEYNGLQHYQSGYGWNDIDNHNKTVERDNKKRIQCKRLKIPLYEIPYWDYDVLDTILENIIKEITSKTIEEAHELVEE